MSSESIDRASVVNDTEAKANRTKNIIYIQSVQRSVDQGLDHYVQGVMARGHMDRILNWRVRLRTTHVFIACKQHRYWGRYLDLHRKIAVTGHQGWMLTFNLDEILSG